MSSIFSLEKVHLINLSTGNNRKSPEAWALKPRFEPVKLCYQSKCCENSSPEVLLSSLTLSHSTHLSPGLDAIQCSLPMEDRRVALRELSEASFSECKFSLSLTDLFIIIFSGVAVSIAAIISSFFLATVVQCFQRCAPNKDTEEDDDDEDD